MDFSDCPVNGYTYIPFTNAMKFLNPQKPACVVSLNPMNGTLEFVVKVKKLDWILTPLGSQEGSFVL